MHRVLVEHFNSLGLLRKSVVRLTHRRDMTIAVDWDIKPQTKQNNLSTLHVSILRQKKSMFRVLSPILLGSVVRKTDVNFP